MSSLKEYLRNNTPVPLIYPEIIEGKNKFTNILLIDSSVKDSQTFVNSVNSSTLPIVYSIMSCKKDLLTLLERNFSSISRIALVFNSNLGNNKMFLDRKPLFLNSETDPYSENVEFIIQVIKEFQVKNIDYLGCNTLNYNNWVNYYTLLTQQTGVIVGASNDKTGNIKYGGDWIMETTSQDIELIYFTKSIEYYSYLLDSSTPWITNTNDWPWYMAVYGNYMYVTCDDNDSTIQRIDMTSPTPSLTKWISKLAGPAGLTIYGNYMYVACINNGTIQQIDMTSQNPTPTPFVSGLFHPISLAVYGNYMYVLSDNIGTIQQIDMTSQNPTPTLFVSGLDGVENILVYGNYMYISDLPNSTIGRIDMTSQNPIFTSWVSNGIINPFEMVISENYMYVTNLNNLEGGFISQINLSDPSQVVQYASISVAALLGVAIYQNNLYTSSPTSNEIYQIALPILPITCFKEDTKILTDKGYKAIQELRKGDLVKTLLNEYKPIDMIGKREIYHPALEERIKDQLYTCSQEEFPEVLEDLIITGCHCILVDNFKSEEEKKRVIELNGDTYVTDNKYRLPACVDNRTSVYERSGNYTIYHIALENDNYYTNYGIYANGLLVETCSKRYLKELSNMTLIE